MNIQYLRLIILGDFMLFKYFILKNIRNYERAYNVSILDFFKELDFGNLAVLVSLGNNMCSEKEAFEIIDDYLKSGKNTLDAYVEIKNSLFGLKENTGQVGDTKNNKETIDISTFNSLTKLYEYYCWQLVDEGFTYGDFWDLDTDSMYSVFEHILIKRQKDINEKLMVCHSQAIMVGQALVGKLNSKPPEVKLVDLKKNTNKNNKKKINNMDADTYFMMQQMKADSMAWNAQFKK